MKSCMWSVPGESRPSSRSGLLVSHGLPKPFCPGAARYWELLPFSRARVSLCKKAAPRVLPAHHPALCLLDIWLDLLLGLLGTEPSSLLLEPGVEHGVYLCAVCAWVENACPHGWVRGRLVLHDCNWKWICRSGWRDCGGVTPHTSPIINSQQCSRVYMHRCWSQTPGLKSYLYLVWPSTSYLPFQFLSFLICYMRK